MPSSTTGTRVEPRRGGAPGLHTQYSVLSTPLSASSAGLLVRRVLAAEAAVLLELDALASIALVLLRHVVAPLALLARKVDRRSFVAQWSLTSFAPVASTEYRVARSARLVSLYSVLGTRYFYLVILVTRPAPTVRPPSRIANRKPSSIAIGAINSTCISVLSPGITISVPDGKCTAPVTSVVRK